MKYVLGNHWTTAPAGWTILKQEDQDLTAPLDWSDNTVEAIHTEHVLEHLRLADTILFLREAHRVLVPGGIIRTVMPFIDRMTEFRPNLPESKEYVKTSLLPYYTHEAAALEEIGLDIKVHGLPFLFDSLIKNHGHCFAWSTGLLTSVLRSIGFNAIHVCEPGWSNLDQSTCLERKVRGLSPAYAETNGITHYDVEGYAVEAKK